MNYKQLHDLIVAGIIPKIENHRGLSVFARERAKFEGWLKVELVDSLYELFSDVTPEKDRVDICFRDWALELKTINTNIRYPNVKNKTRPITKNTKGVIDDIEKLKHVKVSNKAVVFIVFPIIADNKNWKIQLDRIESHLTDLLATPFRFRENIPGMLYFGVVET